MSHCLNCKKSIERLTPGKKQLLPGVLQLTFSVEIIKSCFWVNTIQYMFNYGYQRSIYHYINLRPNDSLPYHLNEGNSHLNWALSIIIQTFKSGLWSTNAINWRWKSSGIIHMYLPKWVSLRTFFSVTLWKGINISGNNTSMKLLFDLHR